MKLVCVCSAHTKKIKPIIMYDLRPRFPFGGKPKVQELAASPESGIEYQKVVDGDCSGIYSIRSANGTGIYGIGSALSCRSRLIDHMNSFNGHRLRSHLHN